MPVETKTAEPVAETKDKKPWALRSLPPLPAVAMQVLNLLDDPEVEMKKVVNLLRGDPAISAELLRVANSALYGFVQRIDTIGHALVVLGTENVKRLALTVALGKFSQGFLRNENLRVCWDHSVACGMLCEELAVELNLPKDRAYTAGLLHDVGRLALLVSYPTEYGSLLDVARQEGFDQLECERQLFDIDHCAAGQWLARHWNLPADLSLAIAQHHEAVLQKPGPLTPLVRCACRLADHLGFSVLETPPVGTIAEILADLPLRRRDEVAADLEGAPERIRQGLQTIAGGRPTAS